MKSVGDVRFAMVRLGLDRDLCTLAGGPPPALGTCWPRPKSDKARRGHGVAPNCRSACGRRGGGWPDRAPGRAISACITSAQRSPAAEHFGRYEARHNDAPWSVVEAIFEGGTSSRTDNRNLPMRLAHLRRSASASNPRPHGTPTPLSLTVCLDHDAQPLRPLADTDHANVGQTDQQRGHARSIRSHTGAPRDSMALDTSENHRAPVPLPGPLPDPHPTFRSEAPDKGSVFSRWRQGGVVLQTFC